MSEPSVPPRLPSGVYLAYSIEANSAPGQCTLGRGTGPGQKKSISHAQGPAGTEARPAPQTASLASCSLFGAAVLGSGTSRARQKGHSTRVLSRQKSRHLRARALLGLRDVGHLGRTGKRGESLNSTI